MVRSPVAWRCAWGAPRSERPASPFLSWKPNRGGKAKRAYILYFHINHADVACSDHTRTACHDGSTSKTQCTHKTASDATCTRQGAPGYNHRGHPGAYSRASRTHPCRRTKPDSLLYTRRELRGLAPIVGILVPLPCPIMTPSLEENQGFASH